MAKKQTDKTQGVVLFAFGKRSYIYAAYNMAFTIKHFNKKIDVCLITEDATRVHKDLIGNRADVFDSIVEFDKDLLIDNITRKFSPGRLKVNLYQYLPYDENLYLDVDGICLKDLQGLFDFLRNSGKQYISHTVGYHTIDKGRDILSMQWAWADDIWEKYSLPKDAILPAINSSIQFIAKGEQSKAIYDKAAELFNDPIDLEKLRMKWGGSQPDELYMNIAMSILNYDPHLDGGSNLSGSENGFIHFCRSFTGKYSDIVDNFYIQSYYGGERFTPTNVIEWLERSLHKQHQGYGIDHIYKLQQIIKDKHANQR